MSKRQTLYRMYDAEGALLYIGITQQQAGRFHQHSRDKSWWQEVVEIRVQHYPDRAAVEAAEKAAIAAERPRYNIVGNGGRSLPPHLARKIQRRRERALLDDIVSGNDRAHFEGQRYWLIQLSDGRQITIHADEVKIGADGSLTMVSTHRLRGADSFEYDERSEPVPLLVLPAGKWDMVHAASVFDGSPIGIDHIDRVETA